jgi:hypothetical protein
MCSVTFRTISGSSITAAFDPSSPISAVKSHLQSRYPEFSSGVRLLWKGEPLRDSDLVSSLGDSVVVDCPPDGPTLMRRSESAPEPLTNARHFSAPPGNDGGFPGPVPDEPAAAFGELRQLLFRAPSALENVVRVYEICDPDGRGARYRRRPEELISSLALDPRGFDCAAVRRLARESDTPLTDGQHDEETEPEFFSQDETEAIGRLQALAEFSPVCVRRVYVAAEKDESMAASLLFAIPDAANATR